MYPEDALPKRTGLPRPPAMTWDVCGGDPASVWCDRQSARARWCAADAGRGLAGLRAASPPPGGCDGQHRVPGRLLGPGRQDSRPSPTLRMAALPPIPRASGGGGQWSPLDTHKAWPTRPQTRPCPLGPGGPSPPPPFLLTIPTGGLFRPPESSGPRFPVPPASSGGLTQGPPRPVLGSQAQAGRLQVMGPLC